MRYAYEKVSKAIGSLAASEKTPRQRMINAFQYELNVLQDHEIPPKIEEYYQDFLKKYDVFIENESEDISELVEILTSMYEELILIERCPKTE
jgi:hypothetical protein